MIAVRFADLGWPIVSRIISRASGHWSNHCDLMIDPCGERLSRVERLIGMPTPMISAIPLRGVVKHRADDLPARREELVTLRCSDWQAEAAIDFARAEIGKPYDYGGLVSWPWGAGWQNSSRWFCSELTAAALAHAGIITAPKAHRLSPGDLYRILKP